MELLRCVVSSCQSQNNINYKAVIAYESVIKDLKMIGEIIYEGIDLKQSSQRSGRDAKTSSRI